MLSIWVPFLKQWKLTHGHCLAAHPSNFFLTESCFGSLDIQGVCFDKTTNITDHLHKCLDKGKVAAQANERNMVSRGIDCVRVLSGGVIAQVAELMGKIGK